MESNLKVNTSKKKLKTKTISKLVAVTNGWLNGIKDKEDVYPEKYITAFNEVFTLKRIKFKSVQDRTLKYTLIVKTVRIEPGFASLPIVYSGAQSDFEFRFVETIAPDNQLCKLKISNVKGTGEYDTTNRIGECYAIAGATFGQYIPEYVFKAGR